MISASPNAASHSSGLGQDVDVLPLKSESDCCISSILTDASSMKSFSPTMT